MPSARALVFLQEAQVQTEFEDAVRPGAVAALPARNGAQQGEFLLYSVIPLAVLLGWLLYPLWMAYQGVAGYLSPAAAPAKTDKSD